MLLDIAKYIEDNEIKFITTSNIMIGDKFDPNGLFSNVVFGLYGSSKWRTVYGSIDLKCKVLHPLLYEIADRRCSTIQKFFTGKMSIIDDKLVDGNSGAWGIDYFVEEIKYCQKIFLKQKDITEASKTLINYIIKHKEKAFISHILVLPPQFRPIRIENSRINMDPINEKYINMLNESQVINTTDIKSRSYKELLQKMQQHVFEAYQLLKDLIKGKAGVQRKSLLGKSMDFSARAVIIGDPEIPPNKVGVPFKIALAIFKPFVIHKSTTKYAEDWKKLGIVRPSILNIGNMINMIQEGKKDLLDPTIISLFLKILNELCTEKVVVLKRDPALHRLNLRAFYPVIVWSDSFHINPLITDGYNADFDGDQMGIYLPLTEAAQKEAKEKMMVDKNIWGPNGTSLALTFKNDAVYGFYMLTADSKSEKVLKDAVYSIQDLHRVLLKYSDPTLLVNFKKKEITIGRAILEEIIGLPIEKQYKKKDVTELFLKLAEKEEANIVMEKMNETMKVCMIAPTLIGKSMDISQFALPKEFEKRKEEAFKAENPSKELSAITKDVLEALNQSNSIIYDLVNSGGRGKTENIQTQIVAKGFVEDVDGSVIEKPVVSSLSDGLKPSEFMAVGIGGRKGIVDRSQMTAVSGYLARQLAYATASVKMSARTKDCGTKNYFELKVTKDIAKGLNTRYLSNGTMIINPEEYIDKTIQIRSPMYCTSPEICHKCLGDDAVTKIRSTNIGMVAAQIIGERGSQMTMQTFHTGGAGTIKNFIEPDSNLKNYVTQDGNEIMSKQKLKIIFNEDDIRGRSANEYIVQIFTIETENETFDFVLNYNFTIVVPTRDSLVIDGFEHIVYIEENVIFGSMKNSSQSITGVIQEISKLLNSRLMFNDILAIKMYELFATQTIIPFWSLELVVSQLCRDPKRPQFPYRLSGMKDRPLRVALKQVALLENWKRGAAFENVSNALHSAILNNTDQQLIPSDLDNLLDL